MSNRISPYQIAKELNVSHVHVYRWIKSGKIKSKLNHGGAGERPSYTVTVEDFEEFRKTRESLKAARSGPLKEIGDDSKRWFSTYREILGAFPPEYTAFRKGVMTFEEIRKRAASRLEHAARSLKLNDCFTTQESSQP